MASITEKHRVGRVGARVDANSDEVAARVGHEVVHESVANHCDGRGEVLVEEGGRFVAGAHLVQLFERDKEGEGERAILMVSMAQTS